MTKVEIIQETADYYSQDTSRRGTFEHNSTLKCAYLTSDGKMCAVGRCLINPEALDPATSIGVVLDMVMRGELEFKEQYKGHEDDAVFWSRLQSFHDVKHNWDDEGLTLTGKLELERLLKQYENG